LIANQVLTHILFARNALIITKFKKKDLHFQMTVFQYLRGVFDFLVCNYRANYAIVIYR